MSESEQPAIESLGSQPYVAIRGDVSPDTFRGFVDTSFSKPFEWLGSQGMAPAGAPFIRYLALDDAGNPARIELCAPVGEPVSPGDGLVAGELPAGRFVTYTHVGPFRHEELDDLGDAVAKVLSWAKDRDIELDQTRTESGTRPVASAEFYLGDPKSEPDFTKWRTRIVMLAAD
ncbi:MAG TPA: GyrI-like domain-containing protein [Solirubrobacterales bacterium]|nr:GyrI-like domain-containing protein [Solirubrobacterales bacterium]